MKVTIQTLKAPWPKGAKVGDIVSFEGDTAPAWAVGKYSFASENAKADFHYEPQVVTSAGNSPAAVDSEDAKIKASLAAAEDQARQEREATIRRAFEQLEAERNQALQECDVARGDLTAALAREADLQQRLDAAAGPAAKTREELTAEAEKLGVKVDGRWSDERLTEEIAKATKK
ncbi:hypothetical protein WAE61_02025 [Comamonadaceae bacterium PP-2]